MGRDQELERWLRWRQVHDLIGLGRTTAWRMRKDGDFHHPVPISSGRVAWRERDIAAWNATRGLDRPVRPPRQPSPPSERRPPEPHVLGPPPNAQGDATTRSLAAGAKPKSKPAKRPRNSVAEGQLGFDF